MLSQVSSMLMQSRCVFKSPEKISADKEDGSYSSFAVKKRYHMDLKLPITPITIMQLAILNTHSSISRTPTKTVKIDCQEFSGISLCRKMCLAFNQNTCNLTPFFHRLFLRQ